MALTARVIVSDAGIAYLCRFVASGSVRDLSAASLARQGTRDACRLCLTAGGQPPRPYGCREISRLHKKLDGSVDFDTRDRKDYNGFSARETSMTRYGSGPASSVQMTGLMRTALLLRCRHHQPALFTALLVLAWLSSDRRLHLSPQPSNYHPAFRGLVTITGRVTALT